MTTTLQQNSKYHFVCLFVLFLLLFFVFSPSFLYTNRRHHDRMRKTLPRFQCLKELTGPQNQCFEGALVLLVQTTVANRVQCVGQPDNQVQEFRHGLHVRNTEQLRVELIHEVHRLERKITQHVNKQDSH